MSTQEYRYRLIARDIEDRIRRGELKTGDRLPSIRSLHATTGAGINTIYLAYMELEAGGVIEAAPKSGFFVRGPEFPRENAPRVPAQPAGPAEVKVSEITATVVANSLDSRLVPLGASTLANDLLPLTILTRILRETVRDKPDRVFQYETSNGLYPLRDHIAARLYPPGSGVSPENVIITNGCMEAVALALFALTSPGDVVAVESPTHFGFLHLMKELGLLAVEVPSDPRTGILLTELEHVLDSYPVKACLLVPAFHNPTGSLMPDSHKEELIRLLNGRKIPVVEDEIYADLFFGPSRPLSLRTWDREGLVVTCSSVSKCLSPGFRTGWMIAPQRFRDRLLRLKTGFSLSSPTLQQHVLTRFLAENHMDRYLRSLRAKLKTQVRRTALAARAEFPAECRFTVPDGGNMLWIELPEWADGVRVYREALEAGISIVPGPAFTTTGNFTSCIRMSCTSPWGERLERAVSVLGDLVKRQKP